MTLYVFKRFSVNGITFKRWRRRRRQVCRRCMDYVISMFLLDFAKIHTSVKRSDSGVNMDIIA